MKALLLGTIALGLISCGQKQPLKEGYFVSDRGYPFAVVVVKHYAGSVMVYIPAADGRLIDVSQNDLQSLEVMMEPEYQSRGYHTAYSFEITPTDLGLKVIQYSGAQNGGDKPSVAASEEYTATNQNAALTALRQNLDSATSKASYSQTEEDACLTIFGMSCQTVFTK
jgi:hypothetical protein